MHSAHYFQTDRLLSRTCSVQIRIRASAQRVWDLLADAGGYPDWNPTVTRIDGTISEGERIRIYVPGSAHSFAPRVTDLRPARHMLWSGGVPGVFQGVRSFQLLPEADGSTTFCMEEHFSGLVFALVKGKMPDFQPIFEAFALALQGAAENGVAHRMPQPCHDDAKRRMFLIAGLSALLPEMPGLGPATGGQFPALGTPVETGFGRVAHRDAGAGPAALFLHAWPLNSLQWCDIIPALASARRCLAPDLLGLGASVARADLRITPQTQVDMLAEYLDRLGVGSVDIVANDVGALVAQLFAARFPGRVRSLLLSNCDVSGDSPPAGFIPLAKAAAAGRLAELFIRPQLADIERARSARGIGSALANPAALTPALVQAYFAPLVSSAQREQQFHAFSAALGVDALTAVQQDLAHYNGPVRILWGTQDRLFSPHSADILDRTFPHSDGVLRLPDANLYLPNDRPDAVIQEARRLWRI